MYTLASTPSSATPFVVTQPTSTVLLAQPAQTAVVLTPHTTATAAEQAYPKHQEEENAQLSPRIDPACYCFFAMISSFLLILVAGYWTANFLLSSDQVFSLEGYKNSSITWGFNNFSTKIEPSQFIPIGLKLLWWILLGFGAIYGLMAVSCESRCNILLVCILTLANVAFFVILTADEGQLWNNAESNLKSQWKDDITNTRFNFRGTGLSRIQYEYQCCGIDKGCDDFLSPVKESFWLNVSVGSGCFSNNCNITCGSMVKRIKTVMLFPFVATLIALILLVFLSLCLISMASQLARFTMCCSGVASSEDEKATEE